MSDFDDTPTAEGATNVSLHQRSATSPFEREVVNIQGDENPRRAIGFSATGVLTALEVDENPFAVVDTEAQFDAALAVGRSIVLRGEGTGGVIALTAPKTVTARCTTIKGPGVLSFSLPPGPGPGYPNPRAITIMASDVTLQDFELVSIMALGVNDAYAIAINEGATDVGHRLKLLDLHIHNWMRCVSKDGSASSCTIEDIEILRCYCHSFCEVGVLLNFGIKRLSMRDSRVVGRVGSESHTTHNAMYGGANWFDNSIENCYFGEVSRIGCEAMTAYEYQHQRTRLVRCIAENCGSMGFSMMFGTGILYDKCVAKNVKWVGFEIGGRPPEQVPPSPSYRYGQGLFDSCVVDGVTPSSESAGQANGISIDGAEDTVVRGSTFIRNVSSGSPDGSGAVGVNVQNSERCSVQGATFVDAGHACVFLIAGVTPNTRGFHEVVGNTFRNSTGALPHFGVWVANTTVSVCNNITWQKSGTSLTHKSNTEAPAKTYCDGVALANGIDVPIAGTNYILPC